MYAVLHDKCKMITKFDTRHDIEFTLVRLAFWVQKVIGQGRGGWKWWTLITLCKRFSSSFTFVKEVMFLPLLVCQQDNSISCRRNFSEIFWNGVTSNKRLDFRDDLDTMRMQEFFKRNFTIAGQEHWAVVRILRDELHGPFS